MITSVDYKIFEWFRKLRNEAAHKTIFEPDKHLKKIIYRNKDLNNPENFYSLCTELIGGLWNSHVEVFGPEFAPGAMGLKSS